MRTVGLDLGERRIGVAVSDSAGTLAVPHTTVARAGDPSDDHRAIAALVEELGVERVVVGLPLSLDGTRGPAAQSIEAEAAVLGQSLRVPVELFDERFTTVTANRSLASAGMRSRERRHRVDEVAATVLLQTWLDGQAAKAAVLRGPRSEST